MAAGITRSSSWGPRVDQLSARVLFGGSVLLLLGIPFSIALVEISAGILLIAVLIAAARGLLRVPGPVWWGLGAWLAVSLLSTLLSQEPGLSLQAWINKTCEYALLCLVAAHLGTDPRRARWLLAFTAATAVVVALDALYQGAAGRDLIRQRAMIHGGRLMGPFGNPNNLASYLLMVMPLQLGWLLEVRRRTLRIGLIVGFLLEGLVLLRCDARGAWLALLLALALCLLATHRFLWLGVLGLPGAVGVLRWHRAGLLTTVTRLDPGRSEGWSVAWAMFRDHPWTGIGWGRYMAHYLAYAPPAQSYNPSIRVDWGRPQYAHNCYLQILAEGGVFSLAAFLGLVGWILYGLVKRLAAQPAAQAGITAGLLSALGAGLLNIGFDTGLYSLQIASLFWVLLGLAAGVGAQGGERAAA